MPLTAEESDRVQRKAGVPPALRARELERDAPELSASPALECRQFLSNASSDANGVSSYQPGATPQETWEKSMPPAPTARLMVHRHDGPLVRQSHT